MTPKEVKALAKACREAGITTFRCDSVEFTLGPLPPKPQRRRKEAVKAPTNPLAALAVAAAPEAPEKVPTDELSYEDLLFYSAGEEHREEGVI